VTPCSCSNSLRRNVILRNQFPGSADHGYCAAPASEILLLGMAAKVWDLLTDQRSRNAVEIAERYADDLATREEMEAARKIAHRLADENFGTWRGMLLPRLAERMLPFITFSIRNAVVFSR